MEYQVLGAVPSSLFTEELVQEVAQSFKGSNNNSRYFWRSDSCLGPWLGTSSDSEDYFTKIAKLNKFVRSVF